MLDIGFRINQFQLSKQGMEEVTENILTFLVKKKILFAVTVNIIHKNISGRKTCEPLTLGLQTWYNVH